MSDFRHNDAINHYVSLIGYCRNRCGECIFEPPQEAPCPVKLLEENYQLSSLFRRAGELDSKEDVAIIENQAHRNGRP